MSDKEAMLFNLTTKRHFKVIQEQNAILCQYGYGPCFGESWGDLQVREPFNGENMCRSCTTKSNYGIKIDSEGRNNLTNEVSQEFLGYKISSFTILELEVWEVSDAAPIN